MHLKYIVPLKKRLIWVTTCTYKIIHLMILHTKMRLILQLHVCSVQSLFGDKTYGDKNWILYNKQRDYVPELKDK